MTDALGEDENGAPVAQHARGRGEHGRVARAIVPRFLAPVHRDGADQPEDEADEGITEERRLGDGGDRSLQGGHEQHGVEQRIVMVRGDDEGTVAREALGADHIDTLIEHLHDPAQERANDPRSSPRARSRTSPSSATTTSAAAGRTALHRGGGTLGPA